MFAGYTDFMNAVMGLLNTLGILDALRFGVLAIATIGIAYTILRMLK